MTDLQRKTYALHRSKATLTEFFLIPKELEKWMHQNQAQYVGTFIPGVLLDNFVVACKRGFAAVYEHPLNEWTSNYRVEYEPQSAQEMWSRWYQFEEMCEDGNE